jgi:2-oxoglutarate ferredoxin oxidoreductase subunit beta
MDDLTTHAENTWCPGCGNFGILKATQNAIEILEKKGITRDNIVISAGIGCHGKIFDYLNLSGIYSLHGRSVATIQGIKLANPALKVVAFVGDGDAYGEGLAHLIFAAKRNADVTVIVHDNGVYALTTGQFTPATEKGFKSRSSPRGNIEEPLNPLALLLEAGATFVARGYPVKLAHLTTLIVHAIEHEGFSFLDVLQPCVSFNDTYSRYNASVEILDTPSHTYDEAMATAKKKDTLPVGIFYKTHKPVYHHSVYNDWNPAKNRASRQKRIRKIKEVTGM